MAISMAISMENHNQPLDFRDPVEDGTVTEVYKSLADSLAAYPPEKEGKIG